MSLRYDFNASNLAARRFNPQLQHLGVIEFEIENLIGRSSREFLGLGISSFDLPQVRSVSKVTVHYLNGSVNYPGKPEAVGDLTVVFNDYIDGRQRAILLEWFKFVYDKRSGLGGLPSDIKVDAYAVLLSQDGGNRAVYRMKGLFPLSDPPLAPVNYQDTGTIKSVISCERTILSVSISTIAMSSSPLTSA